MKTPYERGERWHLPVAGPGMMREWLARNLHERNMLEEMGKDHPGIDWLLERNICLMGGIAASW